MNGFVGIFFKINPYFLCINQIDCNQQTQTQTGRAPCWRRKKAQEDGGGCPISTAEPGQEVPEPGVFQSDSQEHPGQAGGSLLRGPVSSQEEELEGL